MQQRFEHLPIQNFSTHSHIAKLENEYLSYLIWFFFFPSILPHLDTLFPPEKKGLVAAYVALSSFCVKHSRYLIMFVADETQNPYI
jgi:hypothetical protein